MPGTKTALFTERGHLIDQKFLGRLTAGKAARLAEIDAELDRREAPQAKHLKRQMDREHAALDLKIAAIEAKIADSATDGKKSKPTGIQEL